MQPVAAQGQNPRQVAFAQLTQSFGQERVGNYNQHIDYERIQLLFTTRRYDFDPRLIKTFWNIGKDVRDVLESDRNPLDKLVRGVGGAFGTIVTFPFSMLGGVKDAYDYAEHHIADVHQVQCDCDSCNSIERHSFRNLTTRNPQEINTQTMAILHNCNQIAHPRLRNSDEYWPPAPAYVDHFAGDYDGGYAAD